MLKLTTEILYVYYLKLTGSAPLHYFLYHLKTSVSPRHLHPWSSVSSRPSQVCLAGWRSPVFYALAPLAAHTGCSQRSWRSRTQQQRAASPWRSPAGRGKRPSPTPFLFCSGCFILMRTAGLRCFLLHPTSKDYSETVCLSTLWHQLSDTKCCHTKGLSFQF